MELELALALEEHKLEPVLLFVKCSHGVVIVGGDATVNTN